MTRHFTNLHLHTEYSLLDGAITIEKLIKFGKNNNFQALAISDHGNIFGAVTFFEQCKKAGIKPVLAMEAYLTEDVKIKKADNRYNHLLLVVQDAVGYKNLCKLIDFSYTEGFYFKPRIDYGILEKHAKGLIATTACLGGHIPGLLMEERYDLADHFIEKSLSIFGENNFYLEIQPADQKDQITLNQRLFDVSKRKGIPLIASGDSHYTTPEDREAHEVMLAIQTHAKLSDPNRFTFGDCRAHIRTQNEMLSLFPEHEDAIWASGAIADRCNFAFETGKLFFPKFDVPKQHTLESFFTELCQEGLSELFEQGRIETTTPQIYHERLTLEIDLIINMGFVGYFLVVSDFIRWARKNNIPVGPGRGSAAGSLVAWALRITDIDPIRYNLLFERFLNPERVTMPDIDIDFCIEGRDKVINYVRERYGHDHVCQIITFGTMMAKGVLKDVARALGMPFEDANMITDLIPEQLKITLQEALDQEPKLRELQENNPQIAKLFDLAFRLEGITRHASKHAAGIVISPEPISDVLPVYVPPKSNDLVTQYAMTELESLGFLKMDFLGLKNLTLIQRVIEDIAHNHNITLDVMKLPLDDKKAFELLARGDTSGVFQLESEGLKDVLRRLQPEYFEDIIAVNALYRPGPLGSGMVDDFIERRHGRQEIQYLFAELEPILKETYGVIVYQEQVMKIASTIGGYSLGEADILRRAMGKKKAEVMAEQKAIFTKRAVERGFDTKKADDLFELMAYFAGYGFNKSHSAAYALIAYQTAYLKAHYPAEFMACLISLETSDPDKMAFYLQEAKEMRLQILRPDVNASQAQFSAQGTTIRFGLQGIKNVGDAALKNILEEQKKKHFTDLFDFCMRVDLRTCNKRVMESLICAGAFDELPGNRAQKYEEIESFIEKALDRKKAALTGQMGLFDLLAQKKVGASSSPEILNFAPLQEWPDNEKLEKEKEVLGLYVSAQPLDRYKDSITWLNVQAFTDASKKPDAYVLCCGVAKQHKVIMTKKQERMAFLMVEDHCGGKGEIIIFPKLFAKSGHLLETTSLFLIAGTVDSLSQHLCKLKANALIPLDTALEPHTIQSITIIVPDDTSAHILESIKTMLKPGASTLEFIFHENGKKLKLASKQKIWIDKPFLESLAQQNIQFSLMPSL